jgi:hypothetical protein
MSHGGCDTLPISSSLHDSRPSVTFLEQKPLSRPHVPIPSESDRRVALSQPGRDWVQPSQAGPGLANVAQSQARSPVDSLRPRCTPAPQTGRTSWIGCRRRLEPSPIKMGTPEAGTGRGGGSDVSGAGVLPFGVAFGTIVSNHPVVQLCGLTSLQAEGGTDPYGDHSGASRELLSGTGV